MCIRDSLCIHDNPLTNPWHIREEGSYIRFNFCQTINAAYHNVTPHWPMRMCAFSSTQFIISLPYWISMDHRPRNSEIQKIGHIYHLIRVATLLLDCSESHWGLVTSWLRDCVSTLALDLVTLFFLGISSVSLPALIQSQDRLKFNSHDSYSLIRWNFNNHITLRCNSISVMYGVSIKAQLLLDLFYIKAQLLLDLLSKIAFNLNHQTFNDSLQCLNS